MLPTSDDCHVAVPKGNGIFEVTSNVVREDPQGPMLI